ncbi:MAG: phenylalanine--tRNA ligase subunit beta [Sedimentisphaerales bacterium]|nr:phenylalanine--tRNA ligase subunit beta [Sedimentisphaerales bacterium]
MKISLEWLREYVDYHDGPEKLQAILTEIGLPVEQMAGAGDDWMLEVEVTSNRPDCLGHIGIAREVAAATGCAFRLPDVNYRQTGKNVADWTSVVNEAPDLCGRYTARIIDEVNIGPSPAWMVRRLETIGLRGISNVVDITNYVLMEVGQPLHSFDYDRLEEGRIVVRRAKNGERMVSIDHTELDLNDRMLVIADASQPVAIAGIMGGLASEVGDRTKTILLESAHFDPLSIRRTSRALTLGSESSYRFERNVDIVMVEWASRRAAALLEQLAGGTVAPGLIDVWPAGYLDRQVGMRLSRLKMLLGIEIPSHRVLEILSGLGLTPTLGEDGVITCTIPSWRGDLTREVDLIEEVIRIHGYDRLPTESRIAITVKTPDAAQRAVRRVTEALGGCGFYETVNVSFVEERYWRYFVPDGFQPVRVQDATRKTNNALRPSLLASLLEVRKRNQDVGNDRCDLYELAAVYLPDETGGLPRDPLRLGLITDGQFPELRGAVEAAIGWLDRRAALAFRPALVRWAAADTGAEIVLDGQVIGQAGQIHPDIREGFDLNQDLCGAELDFQALVQVQKSSVPITPLVRFPGISRDLSLVLAETVRWADIEAGIAAQEIADLQEIRFVGIYRGSGVPAGKKSLTLSLHFRRADQTLTHDEVDGYQGRILAALEQRFQAVLRS